MFEHQNPECFNCERRFNSVFCHSAYDSVKEINMEKSCNTYKKGEYIFKEGAKPFGVFCINYGKVKLIKHGEAGKEQILRLAKPGDPLGYRSLLAGDRYSSSAIALEESGICFIPKEVFLHILHKDSNLNEEFMKLLSHDLKKAQEQITHLAQKPVRERMAEALLFLRETYGQNPQGDYINAMLSREEIAGIVGTATETAIRLLSEFNKEGIIHLDAKRIAILKPDKLIQIAGLLD